MCIRDRLKQVNEEAAKVTFQIEREEFHIRSRLERSKLESLGEVADEKFLSSNLVALQTAKTQEMAYDEVRRALLRRLWELDKLSSIALKG